MPDFKRAAPKGKGGKRDARGRVAVKVFLVDEKAGGTYDAAVPNNVKEVIYVDDASVGEVHARLEQALFGDPGGEQAE